MEDHFGLKIEESLLHVHAVVECSCTHPSKNRSATTDLGTGPAYEILHWSRSGPLMELAPIANHPMEVDRPYPTITPIFSDAFILGVHPRKTSSIDPKSQGLNKFGISFSRGPPFSGDHFQICLGFNFIAPWMIRTRVHGFEVSCARRNCPF